MEELGGGYGDGAGEGGSSSYGGPGRHIPSAGAASSGERLKVQGWSSLTRLHRSLPPASSHPTDPFPPLTTCSISSRASRNATLHAPPQQQSLVFVESSPHFPKQNKYKGVSPVSSSGSFSTNLPGRNWVKGQGTSSPAPALSSNGYGGGGVGVGVGVAGGGGGQEFVGGDSPPSSSSSGSFASNFFAYNGPQGSGAALGSGTGAAAENHNHQHAQSGRSLVPSSSSTRSAINHRSTSQSSPAGAFRSSSNASNKEAPRHERARLSADAAAFVPAVKRGFQPPDPGAGPEDRFSLLKHRIDKDWIDVVGADTRVGRCDVEHHGPAKPTVSDCRSSIGDAERDCHCEVDANGLEQGRDVGDSVATRTALYPPEEPEWEEEDVYLRFRSDALRTARERSRFARGASNAYMRGDHRRAKLMSRQAQEKRLLAEKLNAEAAAEILNETNSQGNRDVWHLDLHGLHSAEAVAALENRLQILEHGHTKNQESELLSSPQLAEIFRQDPSLGSHHNYNKQCFTTRGQPESSKHTQAQNLILAPCQLSVITGVGTHSQGGPTLPFAVKNFLIDRGYQYEETRAGMISVRPKLRLKS